VEFWEWVIPQVKKQYPELIFIAEVYNPNLYRDYLWRGHFDYLYDKVGLYDTLKAVMRGEQSATAIQHCWQSVGDIQTHMLNFLENHDEQRIASTFFAGDARRGIPAMLVSTLMNTNPMMVYFGQALGEPGMDGEGFSGVDGRTTIFDYWTIDKIRRWRHKNKFDGKWLTSEEHQLLAMYTRILNLCHTEKAISDGLFFDLTYVNCGGWRFDEHRQYAFLRKHERDLLIIIANFSDQEADVAVNLPAHAFNYMQFPEVDDIIATDLLTGKKEHICLSPLRATNTKLPAYGGKVLKIAF
jgi:glycosidase